MMDEQREQLRSWAEETQHKLHNRSGGDRDSHDLCDLDAALSAVLALAGETEKLRRANEVLAAGNIRATHEASCAAVGKAEAARLRAALIRVFHRCEGWSPEDVRANVADALGATVEELEGR